MNGEAIATLQEQYKLTAYNCGKRAAKAARQNDWGRVRMERDAIAKIRGLYTHVDEEFNRGWKDEY
jgi:hypothetical protein